MSKNRNRATIAVPHAAAAAFFARLADMPPLSHYPNKAQPYCDEGSDVLAHIMALYKVDDFHTASRIRELACRFGVIAYNNSSGLWSGTHGNPFAGIGTPENVLEVRVTKGTLSSLTPLAQQSLRKRIAAGVASGTSYTALRRQLCERFHISHGSLYCIYRAARRAARRQRRPDIEAAIASGFAAGCTTCQLQQQISERFCITAYAFYTYLRRLRQAGKIADAENVVHVRFQ
jgi:hypothetical protein